MDETNAWDQLADFFLSPWMILVGGVAFLVTGQDVWLGVGTSVIGFVLGVFIRFCHGKW